MDVSKYLIIFQKTSDDFIFFTMVALFMSDTSCCVRTEFRYILLTLLLCAVVAVVEPVEDHQIISKKAILIEPNYTGLDCYFRANEECYWTYDADNFTDSQSTKFKPGQNGYIRLESEDVAKYYKKWPNQFFGPYSTPRNRTGKRKDFIIIINYYHS